MDNPVPKRVMPRVMLKFICRICWHYLISLKFIRTFLICVLTRTRKP